MLNKFRNTKQKEILDSILKEINGFFYADDIYFKAKKIDNSIGRATIYRYLKELKNKKILNTYSCNRRVLYSKEKKSHCHYSCEKTGKTIHFEIDSLDFLDSIRKKIPGTITSIQLDIKGVCDECK
jgi:Fur family transcriptional regulator, ferric uptake regulator